MIIDFAPDENSTTRMYLWYRIGLRKIKVPGKPYKVPGKPYKVSGKPYKVSRDTLICDRFSWGFRHC